MRCKAPILILVIAALVCAFFGNLEYFLYYDWNYGGYELACRFPQPTQLFSLLLNTAPYILLFLQVIAFHRNGKAPILIGITFGIIAFSELYYLLVNVSDMIVYGYSYGSEYWLEFFAFGIPSMITFTMAMISAFKGFSNKVFLIIAIAIGIFSEFYYLFNSSELLQWYFLDEMYFYLLTWLAHKVSLLSLYAAIALYGMANGSSAKAMVAEPTPEQALSLLNQKLELGVLTEEEYRAQRAEIISKL